MFIHPANNHICCAWPFCPWWKLLHALVRQHYISTTVKYHRLWWGITVARQEMCVFQREVDQMEWRKTWTQTSWLLSHFKTWVNLNHTAPNFSEMKPSGSRAHEIPSHVFIWTLQECKYVEEVEAKWTNGSAISICRVQSLSPERCDFKKNRTVINGWVTLEKECEIPFK